MTNKKEPKQLNIDDLLNDGTKEFFELTEEEIIKSEKDDLKEKQITGVDVMYMTQQKNIAINFLKKELETAQKQEQDFFNKVQEFSYENKYNMDTLAYALAAKHQQQYVQALILVLTELEGLEGEE